MTPSQTPTNTPTDTPTITPTPSDTPTPSNTPIPYGRIIGQVRLDADLDGEPADADSGISGVAISLYADANGDGDPAGEALVTSTSTDGTGTYDFPNLIPGKYVVVETQPVGYVSTYDFDGAFVNTLDQIGVDLLPNDLHVGMDFLDSNVATISGQVRLDSDGDGIPSDADSGISGVSILLFTDPNGDGEPWDGSFVSSYVTDILGDYFFTNFAPATYVVVELNPAGTTSTYDKDGPGNTYDRVGVSLSASSTNSGNDFLDAP